MLTGIHFLLTYRCNLECDHCFVYSGPRARGTFTSARIREVLDEARKLGTIVRIYFEGGEPFLYYPVMVEGIRLAREFGFEAGVVTNGYWATSADDAELWLKPLAALGIAMVSLSDDAIHYGEEKGRRTVVAQTAAAKLGVPMGVLAAEPPAVKPGEVPEITGGVMFRGRAVDKLTDDLPRSPADLFTKCPHEDLAHPARVHVDVFGNVLVCQGLSIGNLWRTPLSELVGGYDPDAHPVCGPLIRGGPAQLAREYDVPLDDGFVDACHLCYLVRLALLDRFADCLAPRQVYGRD